MYKLLFEKFEIVGNSEKNLPRWTEIFNNIDELLKFLNEHKDYLISDGYSIKIRSIKVHSIEYAYLNTEVKNKAKIEKIRSDK